MHKSETNQPRRCYSKQELAVMFFPYTEPLSAVRHLFNWVRRNAELTERLLRSGYSTYQKVLTPAQVNLIFEYLGEPGE